jgi:hypothetical protein
MARKLVSLLSVLILAGCAAPTFQAASESHIDTEAFARPDGTVGDLRGPEGWCNAFAADLPRGKRLLTAAHCAGEVGTWQKWRTYSVKVEAVDKAGDKAILIPPLGPTLVPFELARASEGPVRFQAAGNDVNRYGEAYSQDGYFWQTSADIDRGWSGSPVLNMQGQVVGIAVKCVNNGKDQCVDHTGIFSDLNWPDMGLLNPPKNELKP